VLEPDRYLITFQANGGTVHPSNETTDADGKLAELPTPTNEGHDFDGWFTEAEGGTKIESGHVFTADATLYAHWKINTYTVTFNLNYDGAPTPATATTGAGWKLAELPTPTRPDHDFKGWYLTAAGDGNKLETSHVYSANTVIYADWEYNGVHYTITYKINYVGGTDPASHSTDAGGVIEHLPAPERTGYTLVGWFTAAEDSDKVTGGTAGTKFDKNTILYAHWTIKTYTMTFNTFGNNLAQTQDVEHGGTATKPNDLTRNYYTFGGWCKDAECNDPWIFETEVVTDNTTIYAKWTYVGFDVVLNTQGGTLPEGITSPLHTIEGDILPDWPEPTRENYVFDSWYRDPTATGTVTDIKYYPNSSIVANNNVSSVTIYARWIWRDDLVFTITFDANGGRFRDGVSTSGTTGEGFTLTAEPPEPTRDDGLYFAGWYTETTSGEKVDWEHKEFRTDATIYAHWSTEPNEDEGVFEDERDGRFYKWTRIGTQKWMAENLAYNGINKDGSGTEIGLCFGTNATAQAANCETYGRLYSWAQAMNSATSSSASPSGIQGACPVGWHLPSDDEWKMLVNFVIKDFEGSDVEKNREASKLLKSTSVNGTDEYKFTALLGGSGTATGSSTSGLNVSGYWWTATESVSNVNQAGRVLMQSAATTGLNQGTANKTLRYSVRCVAD